MKPTNTSSRRADDSDYKPIGYEFPFTGLLQAAAELNISPQRASRLLRILQIPVHRIGTTILLDNAAVHSLRDALELNTVRPGRKRKSETA